MEKYCTAGQVTDDNMAHAHYMLDTKVYKYTLRICTEYWISTATTVARMWVVRTFPVMSNTEFLLLQRKIDKHFLFVSFEIWTAM